MSLVVAYKVKLIFDVAVFMVASAAGEMPANWAQWWWWRFNRWGRISASFGSIAITALVWFLPPTKNWAWWNRTYLVIISNTLLWMLVTLVTKPDSAQVLDKFYRASQPLGAWRPVRSRIGKEESSV